MFFFVAGVQPKTHSIESPLRRCPSCGLFQALLKRTDHYLSLFFIPLLRVRKGTPFVECRNCGTLFSETGEPLFSSPTSCPHCDAPVERAFRFCPSCGRPLA